MPCRVDFPVEVAECKLRSLMQTTYNLFQLMHFANYVNLCSCPQTRTFLADILVPSRGMSTSRGDGEVIESITLLQIILTLIVPHCHSSHVGRVKMPYHYCEAFIDNVTQRTGFFNYVSTMQHELLIALHHQFERTPISTHEIPNIFAPLIFSTSNCTIMFRLTRLKCARMSASWWHGKQSDNSNL